MARYWSISAVPVSAHPSPLVITTKLAAAILVVAVVRRRGSAGPVASTAPVVLRHDAFHVLLPMSLSLCDVIRCITMPIASTWTNLSKRQLY